MDPNTDPGMSPIRIGDVVQILSKHINNNERPYTKTVFEINNKTVQGFYNDILLNIAAKNGTVKAGQVWGEWSFYYTGQYIEQFVKHVKHGYINRVDQDVLDFWIKTFSTSTPEGLLEMGAASIGHGWKLVTDEITIRRNLSKWEKIYKDTDDPMKWREKCHDHPKEWSTEEDYIFWGVEKYNDIEQKIKSLMQVPSNPIKTSKVQTKDLESVIKCKIDKNETPYNKVVLEKHNISIQKWYSDVLPVVLKEIDDPKEIDRNELVGEIGFFHHGNIIHGFMDSFKSKYVSRPSAKSVEYWKNVFEKSSVYELMDIGQMTVKHGWRIISDEIYIRSVEYKWKHVYSVSKNPLDWRQQVAKMKEEHKDQNELWDLETNQMIAQKVITVIKNTVSVE